MPVVLSLEEAGCWGARGPSFVSPRFPSCITGVQRALVRLGDGGGVVVGVVSMFVGSFRRADEQVPRGRAVTPLGRQACEVWFGFDPHALEAPARVCET